MRPATNHLSHGTALKTKINLLRTKVDLFQLKTHLVPRSKQSVLVIRTNQLMLCREIIAVCSEIHTKHINTLCGQNVEFVILQPAGT